MVKKNLAEILFEHDELLADPSNPSHAYCSECQTLQPIKNFRRRPSPLLLEKWGWDKLLDKKNASHVFRVCNRCAKKERLSPRCFDYDRYDRALKATGQYEFIVVTKEGEKITQRELMVREKREKRRQGKIKGGRKAHRSRYRTAYEELTKQLRTELAKVKYQRTQMQGLSEGMVLYLGAYVAHLVSVRENIIIDKQAPRKPKPTPTDYINPDSLPTKQSRQTYENLTSLEKERVSSVYLY